ncbi:MAG: RagB/SusD family nutrient uptake outer membrane protein, partial [Dysgonamonadaceae bacterium]|nr:RagB/SusD family nutrient uptake outer membrane protein [Dysgonamonadaceae bacterium]
MKKIKNTFILATIALFSSCADYLDIVPDNVATIEHAFSDRVSAERFLATIYSYMPRIGDFANDPAIQASDEFGVVENSYYSWSSYYMGNRIKLGEQNTNTPILNFWDGEMGGRGIFVALRECNIFLENIDNVGPDLNESDKARWIAEVKFFKAFYHYFLLRMYGPIPLIKDNKSTAASVEDVKVYREPFDVCVNYIAELCDEAITDLPLTITNIATEAGRITQPAAATLKAEVLVLGASPLFNGNSDFSTLTDNRGIKLFSQTEDPGKWSKAAEACKKAIDISHEAGIRLFQFNDSRFQLSGETKRGMSIRGAVSIKWNEELIWGNPVNTVGNLQSRTL